MFNFPNAPTIGQSYMPVGGPMYEWDGFAWKSTVIGQPAYIYTGDAPPNSPLPGQMWWESDTGKLYIYYQDVDSAQWVHIYSGPKGDTGDTGPQGVPGIVGPSGDDSTFDTFTELPSRSVSVSLQAFRTGGYAAAGDGGAALYKRVGAGPASLSRIQSADGAWWQLSETTVTPYMFGAKGDGVTDDTVAFQAAFDSFVHVYVPQPAVTFKVSTLYMKQGQTLRGHSQFSQPLDYAAGPFTLTGNSAGPVIKIGNGLAPAIPPGSTHDEVVAILLPYPRQMTIMDISITNLGIGPCVLTDVAPNLIIQRTRMTAAGGGNCLDMRVSYRCAILNSYINTVGGVAINAMDNMNGLLIEGNTVTGGATGYAIRVGQSQAIRIIGNIIEVSSGGIWISSTVAALPDGNCNGVTIENNYFEQVTSPLKIGTITTVIGLTCTNNYISNSAIANNPVREASIQFGRIQTGLIADNAIYVRAGVEDAFWIWMELADPNTDRLTVARNWIQGTPANMYQIKGTYAANVSVLQQLGGGSNFDFMGNGNPIGTDHTQEWFSPYIDLDQYDPAVAHTLGPIAWLESSRIAIGGQIKSVHIVDYTGNPSGASLSGIGLSMGRPLAMTENFVVTDMSTLTFTNGVAPITLATSVILSGADRVYRMTMPIADYSAKFRIRVRYRAN